MLGETKFLSHMLQSSSLDLSKAVNLVEALVQTLNDYRDESFFDDLWSEVLNTAEQCDTAMQPPAKRPKKPSSQFNADYVLSTVGQRSDSEREKESFRAKKSPCFYLLECMNQILRTRYELHQFRGILERKIQSGMQKSSSVIELALFIEPYKEVFFELFKLCKIAVSIPVSTASCEQSFSAPKLVKTSQVHNVST